MNSLLKPATKNKVGQFLFYFLNLTAVIFFGVMFLLEVINAAQGGGFWWFLQSVLQSFVYAMIIVALARIIDLLYVQVEGKVCKKEEKKDDLPHYYADENKEEEDAE